MKNNLSMQLQKPLRSLEITSCHLCISGQKNAAIVPQCCNLPTPRAISPEQMIFLAAFCQPSDRSTSDQCQNFSLEIAFNTVVIADFEFAKLCPQII
jgi:hypothetical protein